MSDNDAFEADLAAVFATEYDTDEQTAESAATKAAAFRADWDEALTTDGVQKLLDEAPYETFAHRFDYAIGALADRNEDCTDSREYRLDGFGELAADPTQSP